MSIRFAKALSNTVFSHWIIYSVLIIKDRSEIKVFPVDGYEPIRIHVYAKPFIVLALWMGIMLSSQVKVLKAAVNKGWGFLLTKDLDRRFVLQQNISRWWIWKAKLHEAKRLSQNYSDCHWIVELQKYLRRICFVVVGGIHDIRVIHFLPSHRPLIYGHKYETHS